MSQRVPGMEYQELVEYMLKAYPGPTEFVCYNVSGVDPTRDARLPCWSIPVSQCFEEVDLFDIIIEEVAEDVDHEGDGSDQDDELDKDDDGVGS
ncbi:hypothetical protein HDU76_012523 [Blyttiomyces sp. JEL0837]|nr:hypothetical protein HDU76_012523 [Blyttiomyces sp. JEL0837]